MVTNKGIQAASTPIVFSDVLAAGTKKTYKSELTGNGFIKKINITFAAGENGTLHITPYVLWNGNIRKDLLHYAAGSARYIAGDNINYNLDDNTPIEPNAILCVDAENIGVGSSFVDVVITVVYEDNIQFKTIIGSKGGNV